MALSCGFQAPTCRLPCLGPAETIPFQKLQVSFASPAAKKKSQSRKFKNLFMPIKVGKRPIKEGKRPINADGQSSDSAENGPSKKAH